MIIGVEVIKGTGYDMNPPILPLACFNSLVGAIRFDPQIPLLVQNAIHTTGLHVPFLDQATHWSISRGQFILWDIRVGRNECTFCAGEGGRFSCTVLNAYEAINGDSRSWGVLTEHDKGQLREFVYGKAW